MDKRNRKPPGEVETTVDGSTHELATRILAVVERYPSRTAAAEAARLSTDQLARQIKGQNRPFFDTVARLCAGQGVSLDWVATGQGPMLRGDLVDRDTAEALAGPVEPIDEILLANLVHGLAAFLADRELELAPRDHARLVVLLYRMLARRRGELARAGQPIPDVLGAPNHPFDIAADPDLADIVHLAS